MGLRSERLRRSRGPGASMRCSERSELRKQTLKRMQFGGRSASCVGLEPDVVNCKWSVLANRERAADGSHMAPAVSEGRIC